MCIIALKPAKVQFTRDQLKVMWDNNPDGAGFMYAEDGEVKIVKGLMTLDALVAAIDAAGPLRKMVIHFRIRTHGAKSESLTHPFWIRKGKLGMVHNGVINPLVNETSDAESDTAVFARKFGKAYSNPLNAIQNPFHRDMLEAYIGHSKMVFMEGDGTTYILNESLGEWNNSCWYSNSRFKEGRSYTYANYTGSTNWTRYGRGADDTQPYSTRLPGGATPPVVGDATTAAASKAKGAGGAKAGSENARKGVQQPLMGLEGGSAKGTPWDRLPFPEEAARRAKIAAGAATG